MAPMILILLPERFAICRLPAGATVEIPTGAPHIGLRSITWTQEETSIVCLESEAPPNARVEAGWRAFSVRGPLDFNLTGVLASLTGTLAEAGISLFALSTFDTDYVLVRAEACEKASQAFLMAGYIVEKGKPFYL
jgi:uncharacterized protein